MTCSISSTERPSLAYPPPPLGYYDAQTIPEIAHSRSNDSSNADTAPTVKLGPAIPELANPTTLASSHVGVLDPSYTPTVTGLVDQGMCVRALQGIKDACDALLAPEATQQKLLEAASMIAKHTTGLCNACKAARTQVTDPATQEQLGNYAKSVATTTKALVPDIKSLVKSLTDADRDKCATKSKPLIEAVQSLVAYVSSTTFTTLTDDALSPAAAGLGDDSTVTSSEQSVVADNKAITKEEHSIEMAPVISAAPAQQTQEMASVPFDSDAAQREITTSDLALSNLEAMASDALRTAMDTATAMERMIALPMYSALI
eukprot:Opistho-2@1075